MCVREVDEQADWLHSKGISDRNTCYEFSKTALLFMANMSDRAAYGLKSAPQTVLQVMKQIEVCLVQPMLGLGKLNVCMQNCQAAKPKIQALLAQIVGLGTTLGDVCERLDANDPIMFHVKKFLECVICSTVRRRVSCGDSRRVLVIWIRLRLCNGVGTFKRFVTASAALAVVEEETSNVNRAHRDLTVRPRVRTIIPPLTEYRRLSLVIRM